MSAIWTHAARGRPGRIVMCAPLAGDARHRRDDGLRTSLLRIDTEMLLRGVPAGVVHA